MTCHHPKSCLYKVPIFNHLQDDLIHTLTKQLHHRSLAKEEHLYQEGDDVEALYVLNAGKIRIYRLNEEGDEQLVRILLPGDFVGEWGLFQAERERAEEYAQALEKSQVCVLYKEAFLSILEENPSISLKILAEMAQRLNEISDRLLAITSSPVEDRIMQYLSSLPANEKGHIQLPMPRKELASYLGTTPETLSRRFKTLEDEHLIRVHKPRIVELL